MVAIENFQHEFNSRNHSSFESTTACHEIRMRKSKCPDMATFMFVDKKLVVVKQKDLRLRGRKQGRKRVPTILEAIFDTTEPSSGDNQSSDDFENNDEFDFGKNQSGKVKVFDAARGRDVTCLQTNENFVDRFVSNVGPFMPLGVGMTHGNLGSGWWKHSSKIVSNT